MFVLDWHIFDALGDGLNVTLPPDAEHLVASPGTSGDRWRDLAELYAPVVAAVRGCAGVPVVVSGDCMTPLAVVAGLQQRGTDVALVWFDAHGDFHTEDTTTSGYIGGLPLAKAIGRGDMTLPDALGMRPLQEQRAVLVDGRDLDPPEVIALRYSAVMHSPLGRAAAALPDGPIHLHVDLDVIDPSHLQGLRFPAPGGPDIREVAAAVQAVATSRTIAGVSVAATWHPERTDRGQTDAALAAVLGATGVSTASARSIR